MDGLWMLTMLEIRPGTVWLMLYCSASRTRSAFRKGEPERYRGTTLPPGKIGPGAYADSVAAAGAGTAKGAGSGGSFCATEDAAARSNTSCGAKSDTRTVLIV